MPETIYNEAFFAQLHAGAKRSARRVLPLVTKLFPIRSVVDVGCGQGTWLSVVRELGVDDVRGIDGDYVKEDSLQIPRQYFVKADLSHTFTADRTFDLALCLEVVEHLPPANNKAFVEQLTGFSSAILFSGSLPHQEGINHINEQWLEYWVERFAESGYCAVDCIRPQVWNDPEVDWWYAQNTLLYIRKSELHRYPRITDYLQGSSNPLFSCIHPRLFLYKESKLQMHSSFREILAEAFRRVYRKVTRKPASAASHLLASPITSQARDLNLPVP